MNIHNESLDYLEQKADKMHNPYLMFQIQILREIRELKVLIQEEIKHRNNPTNSTK